MKTEKRKQIDVFIKLLIIFVCAGLYAWGGMEYKWLRRFLAPSICGITMFYFSRDWLSLFTAPLIGIASSIGYGATEFWMKVFKRAYVGLAFGVGASFYSILRKNWIIVGFTFVMILSAYILFGVWNPFPDARHEETILGLLVYTMPIMNTKGGRDEEVFSSNHGVNLLLFSV